MSEEKNNRKPWDNNDLAYKYQKTVEHPNRGTSDRFTVTKFFNESLKDDSDLTDADEANGFSNLPGEEAAFEAFYSDYREDEADEEEDEAVSTDEMEVDDDEAFESDDYDDSEDFYDEDVPYYDDEAEAFEDLDDSDEAYARFHSQTLARQAQYDDEEEAANEKVKREKVYGPILKKMWLPLLISTVVFLSALYFISPISKIGAFTVIGNTHETAEQIATTSGLKTGDSIYSIYRNQAKINQKIETQFPRVESSKISFAFPNKVQLKIVEYATVAAVQQNKSTYLVLSNGYVVKDTAATEAQIKGLPLLVNFTDAEVQTFVSAYEGLTPSLKALITKVTKTPTTATPDFIAIQMSDGNQVRVSLSQMAVKLPYYPSIAKQGKAPQVVDMEAGIYAKSLSDYQKDLSVSASQKAAAASAKATGTSLSSTTSSLSSASTTTTTTSSN